MKNKSMLCGVLIGVIGVILFACVIPNPDTKPIVTTNTTGVITTNLPPKFIVDGATLSNFFSQLKDANAMSAPVNPYSGPIDLGLKLGLGLTTVASGLLAWFKNKRANTATTALVATIKGVEDATVGIVDSPVKLAIEDRAKTAGVATFLDQHVQANT